MILQIMAIDLVLLPPTCWRHANIMSSRLRIYVNSYLQQRNGNWVRQLSSSRSDTPSLSLLREDHEDEEFVVPSMLPPPSRSSSPELLSSDDEDAPPIVPATLRTLSLNYLPALPPKHTYLRTPVSFP